jgi:hypothetical protein
MLGMHHQAREAGAGDERQRMAREIYAKFGVNDRAAAVATGFERGLLPRP